MAPKKKEGFEALYLSLEETVARLEEGGLTLQESLAMYEEGMKLARRCQDLLQQAELRVTQLQEAFAGEPEGSGKESEGRLPEEETPLDGSTGSL